MRSFIVSIGEAFERALLAAFCIVIVVIAFLLLNLWLFHIPFSAR
jgi:hypothetical protein